MVFFKSFLQTNKKFLSLNQFIFLKKFRHITQINLIAAANQEFNIMIEGIVGPGYRSDISIDDYQFKERECEPLGDCDFEEDTCIIKIKKIPKFLS